MQDAALSTYDHETDFNNLILIQFGLLAEFPELKSASRNEMASKAVQVYKSLGRSTLRRYVELILKYHSINNLGELFKRHPICLFMNASIEYLWFHVYGTSDFGLVLALASGYQAALKSDLFSGRHVSPLHLAARDSPPMVVDIFLQMGLRFDIADHSGRSILHYALKNLPVLEYLESTGILSRLLPHCKNLRPNEVMALLPKKPPKQTVVFDLDGTLVLEITDNDDFFNIFKKKGLTVYAGGCHYIILPGALELIRLMADKPEVELAFYTHGVGRRNPELVLKLFQMALGELKGKVAFNKCRILSRNDCIPHLPFLEEHRAEFGVVGQDYTKNLLLVRNTVGDIIIVEDRRKSAFPRQEANLLFLRLSAKREKCLQAFRNIRQQHKNKTESNPRDFFYVNQLYYATAMIDRAFTTMQRQKVNFRQALLSVQYQKKGDQFVLQKHLSKDKAVYVEGRNLLRKVHPNLCFFSKKNYHKYFRLESEFIKANQQVPLPDIVTPTLVKVTS